jgi:hypothetical protein
MTRFPWRLNPRETSRSQIGAVLLGISALALLHSPSRSFAADPLEGFGNGLTLGMRHDIIQRQLGPFVPDPNEYPTFSVSTRDWAAPYTSYWRWYMTEGDLPKSNSDGGYLPGLVFGLHADGDPLPPDLHPFYTRSSDAEFFNKGYYPCESQEYGRYGRTAGDGLKWVESMETWSSPYPWFTWQRVFTDIYLLPTGTMVGLVHSRYGNQWDRGSFIPLWFIEVNGSLLPLWLDPRPSFTSTDWGNFAKAVMHVLGFDIMYGGDGGLDQNDGEGFYWYKKVAPPFQRGW